MTEGIIQKIIKELVLDTPATWYHRSTFITLEAKLIEAIKQEFNNIHYNRNNKELVGFYKVWIDYFTRILIGDNQE